MDPPVVATMTTTVIAVDRPEATAPVATVSAVLLHNAVVTTTKNVLVTVADVARLPRRADPLWMITLPNAVVTRMITHLPVVVPLVVTEVELLTKPTPPLMLTVVVLVLEVMAVVMVVVMVAMAVTAVATTEVDSLRVDSVAPEDVEGTTEGTNSAGTTGESSPFFPSLYLSLILTAACLQPLFPSWRVF